MIQIRIQSTPNPDARKYIVNRLLKSTGKVSYRNSKECQHVPLAKELIEMPGVTQVHFFGNVLTVTQDKKQDWSKLDTLVQEKIIAFVENHDPNFIDKPEEVHHERIEETPEIKKINEIMDRTIRPSLQMDGGDIEVLDLDGDILTIRYLGACGGCPSSMTQTLEALNSILRAEYNENIEVVTV